HIEALAGICDERVRDEQARGRIWLEDDGIAGESEETADQRVLDVQAGAAVELDAISAACHAVDEKPAQIDPVVRAGGNLNGEGGIHGNAGKAVALDAD